MFGGAFTSKQRYSAIGICFLLFVTAPFVPNGVLAVTVGNPVGVFALLAATLVLIRKDMTVGIATFLAAGALFFENRKRLLLKVQAAAAAQVANGPSAAEAAALPTVDTPPKLAPVASVAEGAADLVDGEVHPEHEQPEGESVAFAPAESTGSDAFERVGESIDAKAPLATGATAADYVKAGLV